MPHINSPIITLEEEWDQVQINLPNQQRIIVSREDGKVFIEHMGDSVIQTTYEVKGKGTKSSIYRVKNRRDYSHE